MESLLIWGIENSDPSNNAAPAAPRDIKKLDPAIIDAILGKPETVQMKEALEAATNEGFDEETRVAALDEFEMLVEQIDNANNVTSMKMWKTLLSLLDSTSDPVRVQTLWVLATIVQNNPKSQEAFLAEGALPIILTWLHSDTKELSAKTRSKAAYCISGALKHSRAGVQEMAKCNGWETFNIALLDSDVNIRQRIAFLLNALLFDDGSPVDQPATTTTHDLTRDAIQSSGILSTLIKSISQPTAEDEDFVERAAGALLSYQELGGKLSLEQQEALAKLDLKKLARV